MAVNAWDTYRLIEKIEERKGPIPYFMARYFGSQMLFDSEEVHFDYVLGERRMAPFVSPVVQGKVMRTRGSTMKSFRPAYVKPKHAIRPTEALKRRPGEAFGGSLSNEQRFELAKVETLREQDEMIDNRIEWMCLELMKNGSLTIQGDDYPVSVVDYGRDANNTIVLSGTDLWSDTTNADPLQSIEDAATQMANADFGAPGRDIYMNPTTYKAFKAHPKVKDQLDTNFRGSSLAMDRGPQVFDKDDEPVLVATVGIFSIYVDYRQYEDEAGAMQPYFADGEVLLCSTALDGVQAFGAIMDTDQMMAVRAFPKVWKEQDPSAWFGMTQSAPLPIAKRINATAMMTVL